MAKNTITGNKNVPTAPKRANNDAGKVNIPRSGGSKTSKQTAPKKSGRSK
jgi:hypothetical protein